MKGLGIVRDPDFFYLLLIYLLGLQLWLNAGNWYLGSCFYT